MLKTVFSAQAWRDELKRLPIQIILGAVVTWLASKIGTPALDQLEQPWTGLAYLLIFFGCLFVFTLIRLLWKLEPATLRRGQKSDLTKPDDEPHVGPRSVTTTVEPISLLDFAKAAERQFSWDLFSKSEASGWQTWDLKSGLEHAAGDGKLKFEGKRFAIYSSPPDSPFLRRDELFQQIRSEDWLEQRLKIIVPGSQFGWLSTNFDLSIVSTIVGNRTRYWDVRLSDHSAAIEWLERDGARFRGESERLHREEEARKAAEREAVIGAPDEEV